ncbi:glycosyltransferase family 32 protein [Pseudobutyrivibrio sp.]|uniref:glycosyltransferase family 32 protein n=1 Tax=Pseudobutyrivibrio sp. TaxID=2014367 RepID=UPI0025E1D842|nr:glycosyltransferase [Pseudobutyrivibrio sp.]MBR5648190.1 hypothetical protein [Pseudobutyrivibrio sp.]
MLEILDLNLSEFKNYVVENKVYIFGAGIQGQRWMHVLEDWNLNMSIAGFIDNDSGKWGTVLSGDKDSYVVNPISEIKKQKDISIFVTSIHFEEICTQLADESDDTNWKVIVADKIAEKQMKVSDYESVIKESEQELIPRIIHYAWFGGEMPDVYKRNIDEWQKRCPDFEFKFWNEKNYDVTKNRYMSEAYDSKKWAFASDYFKLDVIYNQGGIYLDTDIKMVKNPSQLLYQKAFGCVDCTMTLNIGSGFGAAPKSKLVKKLLDDYENARFIREDGSLDNTSCNTRQYMVIRKMGFVLGDNQQKVMDMNIYPMIFQGACSHTKTIRKTDKTFWIHYENMSWL